MSCIVINNFVYINKHLLPVYIPGETVIIAVNNFVDNNKCYTG